MNTGLLALALLSTWVVVADRRRTYRMALRHFDRSGAHFNAARQLAAEFGWRSPEVRRQTDQAQIELDRMLRLIGVHER